MKTRDTSWGENGQPDEHMEEGEKSRKRREKIRKPQGGQKKNGQ